MKGKLLVHIIVILILILQYGCGDGDGVDDREDFESTGYYMNNTSIFDISKVSLDDSILDIMQPETGVDTLLRYAEEYINVEMDPRFPLRIVSMNGTTLLMIDTPLNIQKEKIENAYILRCLSEACSGRVYILIRSPENHLLMRQIWIHSKYLLGKLRISPNTVDLRDGTSTLELINLGKGSSIHILPIQSYNKCTKIYPNNQFTTVEPENYKPISISRTTCPYGGSEIRKIPVVYYILTANGKLQFYLEHFSVIL